MTYTATWRPPEYVAAPGRPPANPLGMVQLVGDVQTDWESIAPLDGTTTYDAIGRDIQDRLVSVVPAARIQMGDISDGDANFNVNLLKARFDHFDAWCGGYGIPMRKVMGNHDVIQNTLTPAQWAAYMGYPGPSYALDDLGGIRVLVMGGSLPAYPNPSGWASYSTYAQPPLQVADVAWLDQQLAADSRPTVVMSHTPFASEPTAFSSHWALNTSTIASGGTACTDLLSVLDSHDHAIAWAHGHTHDDYRKGAANTGLMSVGSRSIARIDAGACYTQPPTSPAEVGAGLPVTFYVSVLDDGKTIDIRWRDHGRSVWAGVSDHGRSHRLVTT